MVSATTQADIPSSTGLTTEPETYTTIATGALAKILSPAFQPAVYFARQACISLLARLDLPGASGVMEIIEKDGKQITLFGDPISKRSILKKEKSLTKRKFTHATLNVKNEMFWIRLALGSDLGFAESYMLAEVETNDLGDCFKLFIQNREILSNLSIGLISKASSYLQSVLNRRYANTKSGSLRNIGAHYDISNRMYEAFLSQDMMYSCAVFPALDADITGPLLESVQNFKAAEEQAISNGQQTHLNGHSHSTRNGGLPSERGIAAPVRYDLGSQQPSHDANAPDGQLTPPDSITGAPRSPLLLARDELEDGQLRKVRLHLDRACLQSNHHLLEIGTGWGTLAIEAVRSSGCSVDSLTLSVEQKALAEERIAQAGLSNKIKVHLMDYRDMPLEWNERFDRIISIEMLEAVGIEYLPTYFQHVDRVLKRETGVCVVQVITMPEERFDTYINEVDFIRKWIFPGGVLPSVTSLIDAARKGAKGTLILDTVHSIGPHYARTLREWRQRFEHHFDDRIRPALLDDHAEIRHLSSSEKQKQVQIFRRKWLYYFIYCEIGFTERVIGDHILSFTRSGNKSLPVCCM